MTAAYSYLRFSTPEQMRGDSFRRQSALARAYATKHGLDLDEGLTFHDLGVSAFRGRNAEAGRLADFLEAVRAGLVSRGSYLLVESLDRISRQAARKALRVLENIVDEGVTVVTLSDGRAYDANGLNDDPMSLMLALMIFIRSNEESATKARRLKASWENKRRNAAERPVTGRCPAWMQLRPDRTGFDLIPERAAIVRRAYEMAAGGVGQHRIAATFNAEGILPWGDAGRAPATQWRRSYVLKLLRSPAAVGTFVPHTVDHENGRKVRRALEPVRGYFPAVVDEELFQQVQALREGGLSPGRGRHAGRPVRNVLGGLAKCGRCGASMTRVVKGSSAKAGPPYLVCEAAKGGKRDPVTGDRVCEYKAVRLSVIEGTLAESIWEAIALAPLPAEAGSRLDGLLVGLEERLDAMRRQAKELAQAVALGGPRTLVQTLRDLEGEMETTERELTALLDQRAAAQGPFVERRMGELRAACAAIPFDPGAVNARLRAVCTAVVVDPREGTLEFDWTHGATSSLVYDDKAMAAAWRERLRKPCDGRGRSTPSSRPAS